MFSWYHWIVVAVPVLAVCALAVRCRRYVRSVSDFLVAGRCAGRYVLLSGGMMGNLAVTSLVAWVETHYNNGWAFQFWNSLLTPLAIMLSLYGWITYRFREPERFEIIVFTYRYDGEGGHATGSTTAPARVLEVALW